MYIHGLFLEGAGWDFEGSLLTDPSEKSTMHTFPVTMFLPVVSNMPEIREAELAYRCPLYVTAARGGAGRRKISSSVALFAVTLPLTLPFRHCTSLPVAC